MEQDRFIAIVAGSAEQIEQVQSTGVETLNLATAQDRLAAISMQNTVYYALQGETDNA